MILMADIPPIHQLMPKRVIKRGVFTVDLYKVVIEVTVLATAKDVSYKARQLFRKYGWDPSEVAKECYGYALNFSQHPADFYILLTTENLTVNTITHEVDHVRQHIMNFLSLTGEEESANLSGYINEKVFGFLQKNNLQIT